MAKNPIRKHRENIVCAIVPPLNTVQSRNLVCILVQRCTNPKYSEKYNFEIWGGSKGGIMCPPCISYGRILELWFKYSMMLKNIETSYM